MEAIKTGSGLKEIRRQFGMSQTVLAEGLGVSRMSIYNWERLPILSTLSSLAVTKYFQDLGVELNVNSIAE